MDSYVEYRGGFRNTFALILPPGFLLGLSVYLALSDPPRTSGGWVILGLFGLLLCTVLGVGVAILATSSLKFYKDGFSFRDLGTPTLRFQWQDVTRVTVQNVSSRNSIAYRVQVQIRDLPAYLDSLTPEVKKYIEKKNGWLGDGVVFNTSNIQITYAELEEEFKTRTSVPVNRLETAASTPALFPSQIGLKDHPTVKYRAAWGRVLGIFSLGLALVGGATWIALNFQTIPGAFIYLGTCLVTGIPILVMSVQTRLGSALNFEPEGLTYRSAFCPELRVEWNEIAGIHVAGTRRTGNAGCIVVIEIRDFAGYLNRQTPDRQRKIQSTSRVYGEGIAIDTRNFPVSAGRVAEDALSRAGLFPAHPQLQR